MNQFEIADIVASVLDPSRFIIRPPMELRWEELDEELFWEMFQGRLLDGSMTRERRRFHAWNIRPPSANEPLISVKRALIDGRLYVTRATLCYGHESVASGNVIETRDVQKWVRELVGTIDPEEFSPSELHDELTHLVFAAVVGTGRLPLTSLEAPLPDFAMGRLSYRTEGDPNHELKHLEHLLRSDVNVREVAATLSVPVLLQRLRNMFLGVSLSPYTDFVDRTLALLREREAATAISPADRIDFLGWLLRLQWRHLNAYDLFLFHHRGANYPDALLIDAVLRELLATAEHWPALFIGPEARLRRRALRFGWLLRSIYAGHRVPDQPTSPGENLRVLPAPFVRVSEEQIFNPYRRPRELFVEPLPLPRAVANLLVDSLRELSQPDEMRELGTALLLDRPLGVGKAIGEPDQTPLMAHIGRSRRLALRHLDALSRRDDPLLAAGLPNDLRERLANLEMPGVPLQSLDRPPRPGVVALDDAFQTADDFVLDRTTRDSIAEFRQALDCGGPDNWRLILPVKTDAGEVLRIYDEQLTPRLELQVDASAGWRVRRGVELPVAGLRVVAQY